MTRCLQKVFAFSVNLIARTIPGSVTALGHFGLQVRRHLSVAALNDDIAAVM
jgi:hypothetical protein